MSLQLVDSDSEIEFEENEESEEIEDSDKIEENGKFEEPLTNNRVKVQDVEENKVEGKFLYYSMVISKSNKSI